MADLICTTCGAWGAGKRQGSTIIEIVLWLCYLIPGLIYTVWRSEKRQCLKCGSKPLRPLDSPEGQNYLALAAPPETKPEAQATQIRAEIMDLKKMLEEGIIDNAEYSAAKKRILGID